MQRCGPAFAPSRPVHWIGIAVVTLLHLLAFFALNHRMPIRLGPAVPALRLMVISPPATARNPYQPMIGRSQLPVPLPISPPTLPDLPSISGPGAAPAKIIPAARPAQPLDLRTPSFRDAAPPALPDQASRLQLFRDDLAEDDRIGNLARPKITDDDCDVADQSDLDADGAVPVDPTGSHHSLPGLACRAHQTLDGLKASNNRLTPR